MTKRNFKWYPETLADKAGTALFLPWAARESEAWTEKR
jgi:hypothetical protein